MRFYLPARAGRLLLAAGAALTALAMLAARGCTNVQDEGDMRPIIITAGEGAEEAQGQSAAVGEGAEAAQGQSVAASVGGRVVETPLEEYVYRVLAAEMPASYHMEALKAQAVAIRSYTLSPERAACKSGADVCDLPGCCQGYATDEELKAVWGDGYDGYSARLREAVDATRGVLLTYGGEAALALYHASAGGHTQDSGAVFAAAKPYLAGVSSPDGGDVSVAAFSADEAASLLGTTQPLCVTSRAEGGAVTGARAGDVTLTGTQVRTLFGLQSAVFDVTVSEGGLTFTVHGRGHGVGMSQRGAQAMALEGSSWQEILAHYYSGAQITRPEE